MSSRVAIATALALATALFYAISNVLELLEAEKVPDEYAMRPGLAAAAASSDRAGCSVCSPTSAATSATRPRSASRRSCSSSRSSRLGILMSLFIGSRFVHRPVLRADWIAAGVLVGRARPLPVRGVADRRPSDRDGRASGSIAGPSAVARDRDLHGARRRDARAGRAPRSSASRPASRSASRRCLTKALVHYLGDGIFAWVPHWEPYALAVSAIGGVIVAQSALQTGALGAAVGSIESMSVISGSLFGLFLLDEHVGAHSVVPDLRGRRVDRRDPRGHRRAVAGRGAHAWAMLGPTARRAELRSDELGDWVRRRHQRAHSSPNDGERELAEAVERAAHDRVRDDRDRPTTMRVDDRERDAGPGA